MERSELVEMAYSVYCELREAEKHGKGTKKIEKELYELLDSAPVTMDALHEVYTGQAELENI